MDASVASSGVSVALALAALDRFRRCSGISVNLGSGGVGRVRWCDGTLKRGASGLGHGQVSGDHRFAGAEPKQSGDELTGCSVGL